MAFVVKRLHSLQRTFHYLGISFARNYRNFNPANRLSAVTRASFSTKGSLWSTSAVGLRGHKLSVLTGGGSLVSFGILTAVLCSTKNSANYEKLFLAAKTNNIQEIERLMKLGIEVDIRHELGWTPLHTAVVNKNLSAVVALLKAGADPNLADEFSNVTRVARERDLNSLQVHVTREDEFSDNLNTRASFKGCTSLHYAVLFDNIEIIRTLLEAGANPMVENESGHRPLSYARSKEIIELLEIYESKFQDLQRQKELEERRRFPLEQRIREVIVGQEGAITTVASGRHRSKSFGLMLRDLGLGLGLGAT